MDNQGGSRKKIHAGPEKDVLRGWNLDHVVYPDICTVYLQMEQGLSVFNLRTGYYTLV